MKQYPSNSREAKRDYNLMARYGLTVTQYNQMLAAQNYSCYICRTSFDTSSRALTPQVDHCHETLAIRKLLCASCNQMVASVESRRPRCKHIQRRFDKTPYRNYLIEMGV